MNAAPPSPLQPPPIPPPALPPRKNSGCGGCLIAFACLGALVVLGLVALGFGYAYLVNTYTRDRPAEVPVATPTSTDSRSAQVALQGLREALSKNQKQRVEFTGENLNALIAQNPDFRGLRGKAHIGIADSEMTVQMALPLSAAHLPKLGNRWLNANVRLTFSYGDEGFQFDFKSADAQGTGFPESFAHAFGRSFSKSFAERFRQEREKNNTGALFWDRIEKITLEGDKLVIITKGAAP